MELARDGLVDRRGLADVDRVVVVDPDLRIKRPHGGLGAGLAGVLRHRTGSNQRHGDEAQQLRDHSPGSIRDRAHQRRPNQGRERIIRGELAARSGGAPTSHGARAGAHHRLSLFAGTCP